MHSFFESKMPNTPNLSTHSKLSPTRRRSLLVSADEFLKSFHEASYIGDRKKVKKLLLHGNFSSFIANCERAVTSAIDQHSSVFSNRNLCVLSLIIISRSRVNGKWLIHACQPRAVTERIGQMLLYGAQGLGPSQKFLHVFSPSICVYSYLAVFFLFSCTRHVSTIRVVFLSGFPGWCLQFQSYLLCHSWFCLS